MEVEVKNDVVEMSNINDLNVDIPERPDADELSTPTLKEEAQRYLKILFDTFTPVEQEHQVIWLPIIVSILSSIYFTTLLFTRFMCPAPWYDYVCPQLLIEIPFGGFIISDVRTPSFRWITYSFYHFTWAHILMNMIILVPSLYFMEKKYGSVRMAFLYFVGAVGGALFSWWFLPNGAVLAGASASIYGYIFLYLADLILNWYTVTLPRFQIFFVVAAFIALVVEGAIEMSLSVFAHIGGGLGSLWFSLLILPRFYRSDYEWIVPVISIIFVLLQFLLLPILLYYYKL